MKVNLVMIVFVSGSLDLKIFSHFFMAILLQKLLGAQKMFSCLSTQPGKSGWVECIIADKHFSMAGLI